MENEQNQEQPVEQPVEEAVEQAVEQVQEEVKEDRPEINYKAELERRKANEERLRAELEAEKARQVKRYDPNDLTTWSENDLKAVKYTNDPNLMHLKAQADEELLERKVNAIRERERIAEKRTRAEMELRSRFPQALDASSEFAAKMEQVMYDMDLQKSPAGRLAAAEIVAARSQKGTGKAAASGRKQEEARLKDVKQTLAEGDRPDPRGSIPNPKKEEELKARIANGDTKAISDVLGGRGISAKDFFGKR